MKLFFIDNGGEYDDYWLVAAIVGKSEDDKPTIKRIIDEQIQLYKANYDAWKNDKNHTYESRPSVEGMVQEALEKEGFEWVSIESDFSLPWGWY